ncbi:MAG TPA: hypothetical protein VGK27_11860 [Candidatus Deferrimicrobiaceae bacterium]|jgi:hypothetical protein
MFDLSSCSLAEQKIPDSIEIRSVIDLEGLRTDELNQFYENIGKSEFLGQAAERFNIGALLWVMRFEGQMVSFLWTTRQKTVEPFYFPLTGKDLYVFDGGTNELFRGKGLFPIFMNFVFSNVSTQGVERAYYVVKKWNIAMQRSTSKLNNVVLGVAKKTERSNRVVVTWFDPESLKGIDSNLPAR